MHRRVVGLGDVDSETTDQLVLRACQQGFLCDGLCGCD